MLKIGTLRWKGRCSRHPRYDPAEDGEGGIRGGCPRCLRLLEIHDQHRKLREMIREFGPLRDRARAQPAPGIDTRQRGLFE